ncbi:hypothetical protein BDP27DRAFT_1424058 [Rhodocollybia butyracea]|uniref:Uncharacterized protein n=1 Tax=Rhodocollybia butyracea TaxID=206335 RepID=A0A9P5PIF0_9AGAR|nr:hypothetical protein BDP27DRAFT_1424058 [Rhodocollybia butyracea]
MFIDLQQNNIESTNQSIDRNEGILKPVITDALNNTIKLLKTRDSAFFQAHLTTSHCPFFRESGRIMETHLERLKKVPLPIRELQRGLVELQRAYLHVHVALDYYWKVVDSVNTTDLLVPKPLSLDDRKMGAFVYMDADAQLLFTAGYPVYYVCDQREFGCQIIREVVELVMPVPPLVVTEPSQPAYSVICTSQARSDKKFSAI